MDAPHKPRIAFLTQYFHPEENTTSWLMSELARSLSDDFEVVTVAGQPTYHGTTGGDRVPRRLRWNGVTILRVVSTQLPRQSTVGRILNTVTFTLSTTLKLATMPRADLVFAVTNPPLLHWVAAFVGKLRRIPVVLLIHDQYPEIVAALGKLAPNSPIMGLWRSLTSWSFRRAARVISLGRCMTQRILQDYPGDLRDKVVTIPNWDDGQKIRPIAKEDNPLVGEWGLKDSFVILYAGNIGLFHEVETVIDAAGLLRTHNVCFVFVGDGAQAAWLKQQIVERNLDNVRLLPFRPKEDMPLVLTACDVALITLKDSATGLCVPSKLYGTLASGKPVMCVMNRRSETALAVQEAECGAVVAPGEAQKLADLVLDWVGSPASVKTMGENARRTFDEHYSTEKITALYREVFAGTIRAGQRSKVLQ